MAKRETAPDRGRRIIHEALAKAPQLGLGEQAAQQLADALVAALEKAKVGFRAL
jgi:hypothetical protein